MTGGIPDRAGPRFAIEEDFLAKLYFYQFLQNYGVARDLCFA